MQFVVAAAHKPFSSMGLNLQNPREKGKGAVAGSGRKAGRTGTWNTRVTSNACRLPRSMSAHSHMNHPGFMLTHPGKVWAGCGV